MSNYIALLCPPKQLYFSESLGNSQMCIDCKKLHQQNTDKLVPMLSLNTRASLDSQLCHKITKGKQFLLVLVIGFPLLLSPTTVSLVYQPPLKEALVMQRPRGKKSPITKGRTNGKLETNLGDAVHTKVAAWFSILWCSRNSLDF